MVNYASWYQFKDSLRQLEARSTLMGHEWVDTRNGKGVLAWTVREILDHMEQRNDIPPEILALCRNKVLMIAKDSRDAVIIKSIQIEKPLTPENVLVITSANSFSVVSNYSAFTERYYEAPDTPLSEDPMAPEYALVMPFVTVSSKDGPHDDVAYTAGWEMGQLYVQLGLLPHEMQIITIRTENLPQADLILMHYGYTYETIQQESGDSNWTRLVLIPKEERDDG